MEEQLPLAPPAPGPRNLTVPLAQWLRKMGFLVTEQGGAVPTGLHAAWRALDGMLYSVIYVFVPAAGATFQLMASPNPLRGPYNPLVLMAEVKRLREARFLLQSNVFYAAARRQALAAGTLLPTHLQPTTPV